MTSIVPGLIATSVGAAGAVLASVSASGPPGPTFAGTTTIRPMVIAVSATAMKPIAARGVDDL